MNRPELRGLVLGAALLLLLGGCSREEKSSAPAAEAAEAAAEATPAPTPAPGHEPAPAPKTTPQPEVQPPPPDEAGTTTTAEDSSATAPAASPVAATTPAPPAATPDIHQQAVIAYNQMHASAELLLGGEAGPASVKDMASDLQKQVDGFRQNLRPVDAKMEPMLREASEALAELQTLPDDSPRVEELVGRIREAMRRMDKE